MQPKADKEGCPLCGEPNPMSVDYCQRCQYRLPWAHRDEEATGSEPEGGQKKDSILDEALRNWGLLPETALVCRYCHQPIKVNTKQCSRCKEWLVGYSPNVWGDPWIPDRDDEDTARVDCIKVRPGCF